MRKNHPWPIDSLLPFLAIVLGGLFVAPSLHAQTCSLAGYWYGTDSKGDKVTATFTETGTTFDGTVEVTKSDGTKKGSTITGTNASGVQTFGPIKIGQSIFFAKGAFSGCSKETGDYLLNGPNGEKEGSYTINAPILSVTGNGTKLAEKDCTSITATPTMPEITAKVSGGDLSGNVDWSLNVKYTGPDSPPTTFSFNAPTTGTTSVPASTSWDIPFGTTGGSFIGGDATLSYKYYGATKTFLFCINGEEGNPSQESIRARLGSSPWYLFKIAEAESTPNLYQFNPASNFTPLWNNHHGFGIMQIETTSSRGDLFSWVVNTNDGAIKALSAGVDALGFWKGQLEDYQQWNANPKHKKVVPPVNYVTVPKNGNNCTFSYSPGSGQYPFSDGLGIQAYNGAKPYFVNWDNVTDPSNPKWVDHGSIYATLVCSQSP